MHNKKKKSEIAGWLLVFFVLDGLLFRILEKKKKKRKEKQKNYKTVNSIVLICLVFKIITLTKIIGTFRSDHDYEYEYDF